MLFVEEFEIFEILEGEGGCRREGVEGEVFRELGVGFEFFFGIGK